MSSTRMFVSSETWSSTCGTAEGTQSFICFILALHTRSGPQVDMHYYYSHREQLTLKPRYLPTSHLLPLDRRHSWRTTLLRNATTSSRTLRCWFMCLMWRVGMWKRTCTTTSRASRLSWRIPRTQKSFAWFTRWISFRKTSVTRFTTSACSSCRQDPCLCRWYPSGPPSGTRPFTRYFCCKHISYGSLVIHYYAC